MKTRNLFSVLPIALCVLSLTGRVDAGSVEGNANGVTVDFATTDKPPVPPTPEPSDTPAPNAAIIVLPAGMDIASASSNGNVLLTDGSTYWRWINGVVTKAFDVVPPDGYYNSLYDRSQTGDWVTVNSTGAAIQEIETIYTKDDGYSTLSSNALNYSLSSGVAVQSYQAPYIHYSKHWDDDDGAPIVNYYSQPLQVYMLDASNQLWMQTFKAPDGATDLGDSYPDTAFYKLDLASGTRQALDPNISDLLVNEAGQIISTVETALAGGGASYSSYFQGKDITANNPVYLASSGSYLGRSSSVQNGQSIYSLTVYFQDGTSLPLPVIVNSFAEWGYQSVSCTYRFDSIDQFDQVHLLANNDANGNLYGPDMCLIRKRDSQGKLITPVEWEDVGMQQVIPPAPWTTDHQVSKGQWGIQAGYATPGGDDAWQAVLFVPMSMAVDMNRDGTISLPTESSADQTSQSKPYRFWINDDDDVDTNDPDNAEIAPVQTPNWTDGQINGIRDLEDFARLKIYLGGLQDAIVQGQIQIGLKWKDTGGTTPSLKLWRNLSPNGGTEYLTDVNVAQQHLALRNPGLVQGMTTCVIPAQLWQDVGLSASQPYGDLLFEGCTVGKGQLVIVLLDKNGNQIGEGPGVWIDLKNIKSMYERAKATADGGDTLPFPYNYVGTATEPNSTMSWTLDANGYSFEPASDEKPTYIVFVHGWNQTYERSTMYAETMFKRLWHRGYKGRFVSFRWPTFVGNTTYNDSEYRAWNCGVSLKQYLATLPSNYTVDLVAHSMGNIVAGSALEKGAAVANYALLNAAVPAICYDTSGTVVQTQWGYVTPNDDPDPQTVALSYQGCLANVHGNLVNFFLPKDSALSLWQINNATLKPHQWPEGNTDNAGYRYIRNEAAGQKLRVVRDAAPVTGTRTLDATPESRAFAVQSPSLTVGVDGRTAGPLNLDESTDLTSYGFGNVHSAEFLFSIQQTCDFYDRLLFELNVSLQP